MPVVLQLTDTHLSSGAPSVPPANFSDAVHVLTGRTTTEATQAVFDAAEQAVAGIDLVVHTGDIADDQSTETYVLAQSMVASLGAPILVTPGNHDDPHRVDSTFQDQAAVTARHVDIDGWRVILVSSLAIGRHHGTFSDDALASLADLLRFDGPILIGTHHPPISPCSHPDCINDRSAEFLALIDEHPNIASVVAGHLHLDDEIERRGVRYFVTPSTALQLRHVHPLEDNNAESTPGGARLLDLRPDGSIDTTLIWA